MTLTAAHHHSDPATSRVLAHADPAEASNVAVAAVLAALVPHHALLRQDAADSDRAGKLGAAAVAAIRDAGGFRVTADAAIGAGGLVRLGIGLAELHPAAAWNCIVSNTNQLLATTFAERSEWTQPVTEAGTDVQWCGVFASTEATARRHEGRADTHLVSGIWRYASNADQAEWALLNVVHAELGAACVVVPRATLEVHTRWTALGLRGTGSHTLAVTDLEVPDAQLLPVAVLYQDAPAGPFGLRLPSRLRTALGLAAVAVGAARALHEAYCDVVRAVDERQRAAGMPGRGLAGAGIALGIGATGSRIRAAQAVLLTTADGLDAAVASGGTASAEQLQEARLMLSGVARDIADAAHEVSMLAGSRACLDDDTVGRLWRDTHVAARHAALSPRVGFDLGGRALVDPGAADLSAAVGPLAPGGRPNQPSV